MEWRFHFKFCAKRGIKSGNDKYLCVYGTRQCNRVDILETRPLDLEQYHFRVVKITLETDGPEGCLVFVQMIRVIGGRVFAFILRIPAGACFAPEGSVDIFQTTSGHKSLFAQGRSQEGKQPRVLPLPYQTSTRTTRSRSILDTQPT